MRRKKLAIPVLLHRLDVQPGDVLVVQCETRLSIEECHRIRDVVRSVLAEAGIDQVGVMAIDPDTSVSVVRGSVSTPSSGG